MYSGNGENREPRRDSPASPYDQGREYSEPTAGPPAYDWGMASPQQQTTGNPYGYPVTLNNGNPPPAYGQPSMPQPLGYSDQLYDPPAQSTLTVPPEHSWVNPAGSGMVDRYAVAKDKWSTSECCSVLWIWIMSLYLWFNVIVVIPMCVNWSPSRFGQAHICLDYYNHWYFWVPLVLVYIASLVQSGFSPTRQYLKNILNGSIDEYVAGVRGNPPKPFFHIECYHNETSGSGKNRSTRRVTTHVAHGYFRFNSWWDVSPIVLGTGSAPVSRVRCTKEYKFADPATEQAYKVQFEAFVEANRRDVHQDVTSGLEIDGYNAYVLAFRSGGGQAGCFFSSSIFWLLSFLTLGVFYRHAFYCMTHPTDFNCTKLVQGVPPSPAPAMVPTDQEGVVATGSPATSGQNNQQPAVVGVPFEGRQW